MIWYLISYCYVLTEKKIQNIAEEEGSHRCEWETNSSVNVPATHLSILANLWLLAAFSEEEHKQNQPQQDHRWVSVSYRHLPAVIPIMSQAQKYEKSPIDVDWIIFGGPVTTSVWSQSMHCWYWSANRREVDSGKTCERQRPHLHKQAAIHEVNRENELTSKYKNTKITIMCLYMFFLYVRSTGEK